MSDNVGITPGSGATVAADEATYSGDTVLVQITELGYTTGSEGSRTLAKVPASSSGLQVIDLTLASASSFFSITPSNSVNFTNNVRGIYVGATGDVVAVGLDDVAVLFAGVVAGTTLRIQAKRVNTTNTTALYMVGLV